jgi:hypothetical protein
MPVQNKERALFMKGVLAGRTTGDEAPTYTSGRVCETHGCRTRLSVYNPASVCWQHESVRPYYLRANGRRRRAEERLAPAAAG